MLFLVTLPRQLLAWLIAHLLCQSPDGFLVVSGGAVIGALTVEQETLDLALTEASVHDRAAGFRRRGEELDPVSGIQDENVGGRLQ